MKLKNKGFTLVELLSVLIILALIALIAIRAIRGSINTAKEGIDQQTEKEILDAAEKWSIENNDKFDDTEASVQQVGLNIVFIVDVSGSMKENLNDDNNANPWTNSRYKATADAIQSALTTLKENSLNEVSFVFYSGLTGNIDNCSTSGRTWTAECSLRYVTSLSTIDSTGDVTATSGYIKIGNVSTAVNGGTYTQLGVLKARDILVSATNRDNRIPVIILLTDGAPTFGRPDTTIGNATLGSGNETSNSDLGEIGEHLIKSLINTRQALSTAYNGSSVFMYTIGLGVNHEFGKFVIDPKVDKLASLSSGCRTSYGSGTTYNLEWARCDLYNRYAKNNGSSYDGVITKSFTGTMTADELNQHFSSIAHEVQEATKITEVCVSVQDLADDGYLSKSDIKLNSGQSMKDTYVIASFNEGTNQYSYSIARTEDQINTCKSLTSNSN